MRMKKYDNYIPSSISGIEEIPSHWKEAPIKYLVEINPESLGEKTEADLLINYIDIGNVNSYGEIKEIQPILFKDAPSRARRIVKKGDVVVSTVRTYLKAIAAVESDEENLIASTGFAVLRADEENVAASYLKYAVRGGYFIEEVVASSTGVSYPAISSTPFSRIKLVLPSYDEQRAIAAYLDRKTAQLDTLLAQKQALLQKLHQQRQALINEAVTQGLNPAAPRKPSGVAWLGDVPAHWSVNRLSYASDVSYGITLQLEKGKTDGMKIITVRNITTDGQIVLDEQNYIDSHLVDEEDILRQGDILFNWRNGSSTHVGKTAIFDLEGTYTHVSFLLKIRAKPGITPSYLASFLGYLRSSGFFGASKDQVNKTFNASELKQMPIVVPPLNEQLAIDEAIVKRTLGFKKVQETLDTQIQTLKAYRQSLISEVVTGKVDVRASIPTPLSADAGPQSTRGEAGPARNQPVTGAAGFQTSLFN